MAPRARKFYDRFEQMIATCGTYHVAPAKTRIAFLARVRFAAITSLSEKGMTCGFALPYRLKSSRFANVAEVVPGWWAHRLRITECSQLDDQVQAWLRESYRLMGLQERLRGRSGRGNGVQQGAKKTKTDANHRGSRGSGGNDGPDGAPA